MPRFFVNIPALRPGTVGAYALALVSVAIATALRFAIDPYVTGAQFVAFFPAIIITTLFSGLRAGLVALALSVAALAYFLLPPRFSLQVENLSDVLTTLLFVLLTVSIIIVIEGTRYALDRYQELSRKLEKHDAALQIREQRLTEMIADLQRRMVGLPE